VSWEESGIVDLMLDEIEKRGQFDGCRNRADVDARYEKLDVLFNELKQGARFKTMGELNPNSFREYGGSVIHIGRDGRLVFSGAGCYRLAIAQVLKLPLIPVQIGVCHPLAIKDGHVGVLPSRKP